MKTNRSQFTGMMATRLAALLCGVAVVLGSWTAVQAQAAKKGEKAAGSLKALARTVQEGEEQMKQVSTAMNQMVNKENKDLRKAYKDFDKAVKKLSSLAAEARKRRDVFAQEKEAYLTAWDADIASISKPDIKALSAERRQKVQAQLGELAATGAETEANYNKYYALLQDIGKAAGADLTAGGMQAIAPTVNEARKAAIAVRDSIGKLSKQLGTVGAAMSAKAPK